MALVTFEEIEASGPLPSLGFNPAARSVATTEEEFEAKRRQAAEIASRSVIGAAFEQDNVVASFFAREANPHDNGVDPNFDFKDYIKQNGLEADADLFTGAMNKTYADQLLSDLRRAETNKETLAAAGWAGTFASIAAGTLDLPSLIPGGAIVRNAKGGLSVAKSALMGSTAAAVGAGVAEAGLQASQTGRTVEESYINVGASILLGGFIGGAAAAAMGRGERRAAEAALGRLVDITEPGGAVRLAPDGPREGLSAQAADDLDADPMFMPLAEREDLEVAGGAAGFIARKTSFINPVLRSAQRYAASARQFGAQVYENTIYRAMHDEGRSLGAAAETAVRRKQEARVATFLSEWDRGYKAMREAGGTMSRDEFDRAVGLAVHMGDQSDNPFVAQTAAAMRREVLDPFKDEALRTQRSDGTFLLTERDLELSDAESYGPVIANVAALRGQEAEFLDVVSRHIAKVMQEANAEETAALTARLDAYKTQIDDLTVAGTERVQRISEIEEAGSALDKEFADMADLADDLSEARSAARAAETRAEKEAAKAAEKAVKEQGGERLQQYLNRRAELRRRRRDLTRDNADAKAIKRSQLEERMEAVREADASAVKVFARRMKNIINRIDKNLPGRAQELLDSAVAEVERLNRLLAASEKRVAKLSEVPGEQPEGLAAYVAGERAAAEAASRAAQDLVDQLQDLAARGVSDAEFDELRVSLELKPVSPREERLAKAEASKAKRGARLTEAEVAVSARQQELAEAQRLSDELAKKLNAVVEGVSARSMRRGEYLQRAKDRAAKLTPEEVAAQSKARIDTLNLRRAMAEERHREKWSSMADRDAPQFANRPEEFPFQNAARKSAQEVYDKYVGRSLPDMDTPPGVTKFAAGALKNRTFRFPKAEMARRGWIETSARNIAQRHSRSMAADIELTKRFGRADLREQLQTIKAEYTEMRVRVSRAASVGEINTILGVEKFKASADLEAAKLKAALLLDSDERGAVTDLTAGRDLIRGDYGRGVNPSLASISRSVRGFNYILRMGGVALSSVQEIFRPAMVHGLRPFLNAMPRSLSNVTGKGGKGAQMLARESQLAGVSIQRRIQAVAAANSDLGDPYISKTTAVERLIQKGTDIGSKWNGINLLTDFQQGVAGDVSQHRIMEAILGRAGQPGSFIKDAAEGKRMLAVLGIDERTAANIARYLEKHGEVVEGVRVPNTERWMAEAEGPEDFKLAERAVDAYRNAVNLDVNSIVSRKGIGDAPLLANHPLGALLLQFSGYAMGAHSRVMLRGLQEDKTRFLSGFVAMSLMGGLAGWVGTYRTINPESGEKRRQAMLDNPMLLAGEAVDRSGIFPLMFDLSNRTERITGAAGQGYRFNPLKSPMAALGGGDLLGQESGRASEASGVLSGLGGPTVGLLESAVSAGRVAADTIKRAAGGEATTPDYDYQRALATIPYNSYYGMRWATQTLYDFMAN